MTDVLGKAHMKERPIITVKEAKKLLGKESKDMDDMDILDLIVMMQAIAKSNLKKNNVNKSNTGIGL